MRNLRCEFEPVPDLREISPPVCVQCDYSLIGLPRGSRCPECGADNDAELITVFGWGRGRHSSLTTMRARDVVTTMVAVGLMCVWWGYESFEGRGRSPPTLFIAICVGWFAVLLARRWMLVPPGSAAPMRLRISPEGFEQRLGPGPLKLRRWHRDMVVEIEIGKRSTLAVNWRSLTLHVRSGLIGIEFDASPKQARQLEQQIRRWIDDASTAL